MTGQYETLATLSQIAESSPKPTEYQCIPRELILRSSSDWDQISKDLNTLALEGLVQITLGAVPLFAITSKGLNKVLSLQGKRAQY